MIWSEIRRIDEEINNINFGILNVIILCKKREEVEKKILEKIENLEKKIYDMDKILDNMYFEYLSK